MSSIKLCAFIAYVAIIQNVVTAASAPPLVMTLSGPVQGEALLTAIDQIPYYSFKGIPYAQPPIANLRFLPPVPVVAWSTTKIATKFGEKCLQFDKDVVIGAEDCLFLNVYTPNIKPAEPYAVMVFIHGGDWVQGSGNNEIYGPDMLLEQNVILLTFNYRLGVMGFMSLGTSNYSGNQGLRDQQLALQWVHENIASFGGNPSKVTIFGQGTGSTSCELQRLAVGADKLFYQSIEMSAAFDYWSIFSEGNHYTEMSELSKKRKIADIIAFLKATDGKTITSSFPIKQYQIDHAPATIESKWAPVIEIMAEEPFLLMEPMETMMHKTYLSNIAVLTGYTNAEGLYLANEITLNPYSYTTNQTFAIDLPSPYFNRDFSSPEYEAVAQKILEKYYPDGVAQNQASVNSGIQLLSHIYQVFPIDKRIKVLAQQSDGNTFYYQFGLDSTFNYFKQQLGAEKQPGAAHGDELCYCFKCNIVPDLYENVLQGTYEYSLLKLMPMLFANFAKLSNPIPSAFPNFQPVSQGNIVFLNIDNSGINTGIDPNNEWISFFTDLLGEHPKLISKNINIGLQTVINTILQQYVKEPKIKKTC